MNTKDIIKQVTQEYGIPMTTALRQMRVGKCTYPRRTIAGVSVNPAYKCWENMVQRATNAKATGAHLYTERGIGIDPVWKISFKAFILHIGARPSLRHSIDRIDNNAGYFPGNVRWATGEEQMANRRKLLGFIYKPKDKNRWQVNWKDGKYIRYFGTQEEAEQHLSDKRDEFYGKGNW